MDTATPEISDWSADSLARMLVWNGELEATCYGVPVSLFVLTGGYAVSIYPPLSAAIDGSTVDSIDALLTECRALCREHAPACVDAWQLQEAQRSGLQPRLW